MLPFICRYNILVRTETIFTIPFTLYIALYIFHCWFSKSSYQNISLNSAAVWKLSLKEREMRLRFQNWLVGSVCLCPAVGFSQAPWASLTRWRTTCQASSYHPTHRLAKEKAFPHPVVGRAFLKRILKNKLILMLRNVFPSLKHSVFLLYSMKLLCIYLHTSLRECSFCFLEEF